MKSLVRVIIQFRWLALVTAAVIVGAGVVGLRSAPVDVLPEVSPPYVEVQTEALGLSAEGVEQLITAPLEADLLNGVQGIATIRSDSVPGLSSVVMVFEDGTDVYRARQLVEERLTQAHALPNVSKPPMLLQPLSTSNRVLMIGMSSSSLSAIDQSVLARWTVRPRLMGVPGVANVSVWGMRDQQLQVRVDPALLREHDVTLGQVVASAGNAQVVSPLSFLEASTPGTGGFIETVQQRLQVRHLLENLADPAELGKVPVVGTDGTLRLSDVADVVVDHQPLIGDAVVSGGDGLVLVVEKFPGADTAEVTEGVEEALDALAPGMSGIETDLEVFRPADYLEEAGNTVLLAGGIGAGLLVLALVLLRRSWTAVTVTVASVVVSLAAAIVVLRLLGQGVNALVLLGLGGALALVVDTTAGSGARYAGALGRPSASQEPDPAERVSTAWRAATTPAVYAGLIAVLAIVPLAVVAGRPGALLDPLVAAYLAAVLAAGAAALLVAPALGAVLLGRRHVGVREGRAYRLLRRAATWGLARTGARPRVAVAGAAVLGVAALAVLPLLSVSLLPRLQDRDVLVRLDGAPGTSNPAMTALTADVASRIGGLDGVDAVGAHVGRAVTGDRVTNVSSSDVWVALDEEGDRAATLEAIEAITDDVAGVSGEITTTSARALRDVGARMGGGDGVSGQGLGVLTGAGRALTVRVFGEDLTELGGLAEEVRTELDRMTGVVDPRVEMPTRQATVEIEVDLDRAREAGLTPGDVRRAEATLLQGIQVGSVFEAQKVFDVIVQGDPATRGSVDAISALPIDTPDGGSVALGDVAEVRVVDTPSVIAHDAVSRYVDVTADVGSRALDEVVADTRTMLAGLSMPLEYHAEVVGTTTAEQVGLGRILGFGVGALVAALLLLQAALRSWRAAGIVVALLVPALSGGLLAVLVTGGTLDLGGLVGLLVIIGLATAHAVALGSRVLAPGAEDEAEPRGARDSAVTAAVGSLAVVALLLPAVALGGRPGLELLHPMAVVVLGGLITTLLVMSGLLPALLGPATRRGAVTATAPPASATGPASNGYPAPPVYAPGARP
ncbi:efflux RND transporter permease subunit [uncultured Phycicoccus sp.]|uniref:efflux RND transporter permease subunit n=1 Tax=uncultured Phycicoccus sp. TaxID=661422 RepID=UPI00260C2515|nr:efflux RND transporter permease subunit [uncultured Phycicoccus sp.]